MAHGVFHQPANVCDLEKAQKLIKQGRHSQSPPASTPAAVINDKWPIARTIDPAPTPLRKTYYLNSVRCNIWPAAPVAAPILF